VVPEVPGLKRNSIGLLQGTFQGIAGSAPAGAAVATFTGAAAFALGALPLTALLAFLVVLLNAYIIRRISRRIAGAGGYYSYVQGGLGSSPALFSGFFYIFYQVFALAFMGLSLAVFVPAILSSVFGIQTPSYAWLPILAASILFGFAVSRAGIRQSTGYTTIMAMVEIGVIAVSGIIIILVHPSINTTAVFSPGLAKGGISGIGIGMLFMYTAFSGFGASTPLGEESRDARRTVGLSVVLAILVLGTFYVFTAYVFTVAWGPSQMLNYAGNLVPGIFIIKNYMGTGMAILVTALFINSLLTGTVVITNGTSRVMYSMSREGMIPKGLSRIHPVRLTPSVSAAMVASAAFAIAALGVLFLGGFTAFLMAATAATLGVILVHALVNVSLPSLERKNSSGIQRSSLAATVVSVILFGFIFISTFIVPEPGLESGTIAFVAWIIISLAYVMYKRRNPGMILPDLDGPVAE
jgi:amino acid transporter